MATTTDGIWYHWVTTASTSSATVSTTADDVWTTWVTDTDTGTTTSATTVNEVVWSTWVTESDTATRDQSTTSRYYRNSRVISSKPLPKPSADKLHRQQMQREIEKEWRKVLAEEEAERRRQAELVAQELLGDLIGPEHLETYRRTGRLFVRGAQNDYIINKGGLVNRLTKDKVIPMCVHLDNRGRFPETDNVAGLKLLLEDPDTERHLLREANHHTPQDRVELPEAACL